MSFGTKMELNGRMCQIQLQFCVYGLFEIKYKIFHACSQSVINTHTTYGQY